mmetsp:Transcript_65169/g.191205  ORF Transcript_65169/g.191205 Transcript_65169/m.191205 type:complete len:279 (-) Transcript_65169:515-1351(-)
MSTSSRGVAVLRMSCRTFCGLSPLISVTMCPWALVISSLWPMAKALRVTRAWMATLEGRMMPAILPSTSTGGSPAPGEAARRPLGRRCVQTPPTLLALGNARSRPPSTFFSTYCDVVGSAKSSMLLASCSPSWPRNFRHASGVEWRALLMLPLGSDREESWMFSASWEICMSSSLPTMKGRAAWTPSPRVPSAWRGSRTAVTVIEDRESLAESTSLWRSWLRPMLPAEATPRNPPSVPSVLSSLAVTPTTASFWLSKPLMKATPKSQRPPPGCMAASS